MRRFDQNAIPTPPTLLMVNPPTFERPAPVLAFASGADAQARLLQTMLVVQALAVACLLSLSLWAWALLAAALLPLILALEFAILRWQALLKPAWSALARAWWSECKASLRVFGWQQAWQSRAVADHLPTVPEGSVGKAGVVFVHGYFCNRGFWNRHMRLLKRKGVAFVAVNLQPMFGGLDAMVQPLDAAVRQLQQHTGAMPILVCHSMGGLVARAWLAESGAQHVKVVTIGSPHHGTWLARLGHGRSSQHMGLGSEWLQRLEARESARGDKTHSFTCIHSDCDSIVMPFGSAVLPDAQVTIHIAATGHVALADAPETLAAIEASFDAAPAVAHLDSP